MSKWWIISDKNVQFIRKVLVSKREKRMDNIHYTNLDEAIRILDTELLEKE